MDLSRREVLKLAILGGGAFLLPIEAVTKAIASPSGVSFGSSPVFAPFSVALPRPAVIQPVRSTTKADFFTVTQRAALIQILPGRKTKVWAYNGTVPGPTFRVREGRQVFVTQINQLTQAATGVNDGQVPVHRDAGVPFTGVFTTTHLHGANVEAFSDGHPDNLVQPGRALRHSYPNIQEAATMWYHDHAVARTGRNVYMGLAGFYLLTDEREQELERTKKLPSGNFDIPLVVQDKLFAQDNSLIYPTMIRNGEVVPLRQGVFGDVILVNGAPQPRLAVSRRKYRFRFLNGSTARFYNFVLRVALPDGTVRTGDRFRLIGTEDSLVRNTVELTELRVLPSERYSVVVDFAPYPLGTQVFLENTISGQFGDPIDPARTRDVMRFDVMSDALDPVVEIPAVLNPEPFCFTFQESEAVRTRRWRFERQNGKWAINQQFFDPSPIFTQNPADFAADEGRIDAFPTFGTVEVWEFVNNSGGWIHPVHPHLVRFRILTRNGSAANVLAQEREGCKDSVTLGPNERLRVLMKFTDFAGRYPFHCHNLEHEDNDMMTQFKVV